MNLSKNMKLLHLLLIVLIYIPTQLHAQLCAFNSNETPLSFENLEENSFESILVGDCTPESGGASKKNNRVYVGLVWTFAKSKQSFTPDLSFGYSSLKLKSDSDVNGFDIGVRIGLSGQGIQLDSTRLSYVDGDRNFMSHYGVGYSFSHNDFMATVAAQKSHMKAGADLLISSQMFVPYIEINSLDKPDQGNDCDGRFLENGAIADNPFITSHLNEDGSTCANNIITYGQWLEENIGGLE